MNKRWYPAAFSAILIGCGGSSFEESEGAGGKTSFDAGEPATGGLAATGGGAALRWH